MRASRLNIITLRDDPADAEVASHRLLLRAGFISKSGSGLYIYGPLMQRTLDKIRAIVAEEIGAAGGLEITMPILQERELWERSGRWAAYEKSRTMLTATDRGGQQFGLCPTAEEVVTDYADGQINSYKQLPVCYFQQHTKFRDEIRPRFGLMRVKEFIMMDAYSFHADEASLDETYQAMHQAYLRIFQRCGLRAFAVEADAGAIGGCGSHEFMIEAAVGEDLILLDREGGYAANVERADGRIQKPARWLWDTEQRPVPTPGVGSIEAVLPVLHAAGYPGLGADRMLKCVLFLADCGERQVFVAACVRGDRTVNEVKVANAVTRNCGVTVLGLRPMDDEGVRQASGAEPGFAGPGDGLTVDCCLIEEQLRGIGPMVVGGNRTDTHIAGFDCERDCAVPVTWAAITTIEAGDRAPEGSGVLEEHRGIEVGHIFKLGTKYSAAMRAGFTDEQNRIQPFIMGCYGIGSSRIVAAAVEQYHDERGIIWPIAIAPWHCVVMAAGKGDEHRQAAEDIYRRLQQAGIEAVLDDRPLSPGVRFKDWELIGVPLRVVVGRAWAEGMVECVERSDGQACDRSAGEAVTWVVDTVAAALA